MTSSYNDTRQRLLMMELNSNPHPYRDPYPQININSKISPSKRSVTQNYDHNNISSIFNNSLQNHNKLRSSSYINHHNKSSQQYQALIQFQLARQKQKTRIYQQRLKNKQIFIQQMKQYQDQLAKAFQNCQKELQLTKKKYEQLQENQIRGYLEEIAELKHLVIRLQDQINKYQRVSIGGREGSFLGNSSQLKIPKENNKNNYNYNSVGNHNYSYHNNSQLLQNNNPNRLVKKNQNQQQQQLNNNKKRKERSKTLMHHHQQEQEQQQDDTPKNYLHNNNYKYLDNPLEKQVIEYSSKIANFINHFLGMVELYQKQYTQKQNKDKIKNRVNNINNNKKTIQISQKNLKFRLKVAWRWIKNVVKQWHFNQKYQKQVFQYRQLIESIKKAGNFKQSIKTQDLKNKLCNILKKNKAF